MYKLIRIVSVSSNMELLIALLVLALGIQIGLFVMIRKKKKKERENNVVYKYNIKNSGDAWRLLNDPTIEESDKALIQKLYDGEQ